MIVTLTLQMRAQGTERRSNLPKATPKHIGENRWAPLMSRQSHLGAGALGAGADRRRGNQEKWWVLLPGVESVPRLFVFVLPLPWPNLRAEAASFIAQESQRAIDEPDKIGQGPLGMVNQAIHCTITGRSIHIDCDENHASWNCAGW